MISAKDAARGVGPQNRARLTQASKVQEAAGKKVKDLEELRAKRQAEMEAAQPVAVVTSTADPHTLASGRALASILGDVVAAIEQDLREARLAEAEAARQTRKLIEEIQARQSRLAALERDLAKLQAERDKLARQLAA